MGTQTDAGRQPRPPRVGVVGAPFPDLTPVQREQLAAWLGAKALAWRDAIEAGRRWLRDHPEDETMAEQVRYWAHLVGAWKQAAYLIRVTGTGASKKDKGG